MIEVDDQITKPLNLANSAVLRAVEEEEQQAKSGYKRVAWPPASEERIIREFTPQPQTQSPAPGSGGYYPQGQGHAPAAAAPPQEPLQAVNNVGGGWKHIGAPLPKSRSDYTAGGGSYPPFQGSAQQQQPLYQQPQQQQQQQYGAPSYDGQQQQQQPAAPWQQQQPQQPAAPWQQQQQVPQQQYQPQSQAQAPYQPPQWNQQQQQQQQPSYQTSPYQQQQQQPSYYPQQNGGSTLAQPQYNSYSQPQLPYSQDQTDLQQQQQQPGAFAGQDNSYRGASPGIITLRKEAPVSQQPAPVYTSQPAAVSYQGGSKLRGDLKWPPPEYKEAAARENEERRQLALGPVCRPRRINRDYTPFFAKHQLNNGYPSYKVPPGTQHMFG